MTTLDVRRGGARFATVDGEASTRHSFSFGSHYDPDNTHFGLLVAHNDHVVAPRSGFAPHDHREVEIVTWVLSGALAHEDSEGHHSVTRPGVVQRMSAGRGVRHAERNAGDVPVHFVQMWITPAEPGGCPGYEQLDVADRLAAGGLVMIASGERCPGAVTINHEGAGLGAARLAAGERIALPSAPYVHLFVAMGAVDVSGAGRLARADAVRIRATASRCVTAVTDAEVLVWAMR
ncbi:MAG: pirin family protein [Carbonactinosporaceae bacterium]